MAIHISNYQELRDLCREAGATLVAVSKTKPSSEINSLYELGQRDFGENYVQELADKKPELPADIHWHYIGHLQSNKVKYIASFVHLVHGVDGLKLLQEINKQAAKHHRTIDCLLQVHIAREETKFGLDEKELEELISTVRNNAGEYANIRITGFMGMGSFSEDPKVVRPEFRHLRQLYDHYASQQQSATVNLHTLSMGMSGDYRIALEEGSNMLRIGSLLFGSRN
ncbi:YggS family pyridoxal phosphate-dependent enzyme [Flavihumibacter solisilvae]|uniref:Pyridoxal phosphate homeostasis protein n=1 Tax=Flavihumibacter solisilvae TaxID=1349421 RepID=A0A0C1LG04_9BACT|nr:YggS family pyridoxal phosphate-dependent enzyme [Flavihumibacter solisilvae]KIC94283.1 alanine racemase [Flavihumibacter solisilvae]